MLHFNPSQQISTTDWCYIVRNQTTKQFLIFKFQDFYKIWAIAIIDVTVLQGSKIHDVQLLFMHQVQNISLSCIL